VKIVSEFYWSPLELVTSENCVGIIDAGVCRNVRSRLSNSQKFGSDSVGVVN
jgi:hypothetical protein